MMGTPPLAEPRLAFMYGTRDTLWPGIAPYLYEIPGAFRSSLERSERFIERRLGWSLRRELARGGHEKLVALEHVVDPALTAVHLAFTDMWGERGVRPHVVAGSSGAEFGAGYGRGVLTHGEAMELASRLSDLMRHHPNRGRILVVGLATEEVERIQACSPITFHVAADGWADSTVVACASEDVGALIDFFKTHRASCYIDSMSAGAHSPFLDSWESDLRKPLRSSESRPDSTVPGYSPVTALRIVESPPDSQYWWDALRRRLRVRQMIWNMLADGCNVFLEIGGRLGYATVIREAAAKQGKRVIVLASVQWTEPPVPVIDESTAALSALGLVEGSVAG